VRAKVYTPAPPPPPPPVLNFIFLTLRENLDTTGAAYHSLPLSLSLFKSNHPTEAVPIENPFFFFLIRLKFSSSI
jgi:hypothetical protein